MDSNTNKSKRIYLYMGIVALVLVAFIAFDKVAIVLAKIISVTAPFLVGILLAALINVPMKFIEQKIFTKGHKSFRRIISLVITILLIVVFVVTILFIVIPQLSSAFTKVIVKLPPLIEKWADELSRLTIKLPSWLSFIDINFSTIESNVIETIKSWGSIVVESSVSIAQALVQSVITISLALVFAIYMLLKKEVLLKQLQSLIKAYTSESHYESLYNKGNVVNTTFSKFISTTALEALILGGMFLVSMLVFSFPYPFLIASIVSFAAFIPIVGAFIAAAIGVILMLVNDPIDALWFVLLFLILQQIEGNIIYPRVVGESLGLPGIWVLFAVLVGGSLFGIVGIFLGVPFVAILYAIITVEVNKRLETKKIIE